MDELFEKMKKLIADRLEIDESKITLDSSFRQDLGADSLDTVEIAMELEEHFDVSIPDDETQDLRTVGEIVDGVLRPLGRGDSENDKG